ncbi:MAG: hypothetical protein QOG69_1090 [Actinomycetota bacterium]|nr:hypothetical protein [Actinomycetota bacterium]
MGEQLDRVEHDQPGSPVRYQRSTPTGPTTASAKTVPMNTHPRAGGKQGLGHTTACRKRFASDQATKSTYNRPRSGAHTRTGVETMGYPGSPVARRMTRCMTSDSQPRSVTRSTEA